MVWFMSTLKTTMYNRDAKEFWSIWNKSVTKNRSNNSMHTAQDFADQFCKNFVVKNINRVYDTGKFDALLHEISVVSFVKFNVENVENAARSLKMSKFLDCENLCIAHVVYAHPAIYMCLSLLYYAMVMHSYVPNRMGISIVIPTVKNVSKSAGDIMNYRPIIIMPVIGKIFAKCIAEIIKPYFYFS